MESGKFFKRHEKKYLISREQKEKFLEISGERLQHNKFFSATVMNIYFDTENDDLIIKSIDKPNFKEKIRIRSYGTPKLEDNIFFEIKTKRKIQGAKNGYKRRFLLTLKDFYDYLDNKASLEEIAKKEMEKATDTQIAREIDYIFRKMELRPKILIACERESFEAAREKDVRVTFDENLRYRYNNLRLEKGAKGKKYFADNKNIILEIKTTNSLPIWLVKALNECKIYPQPFSKYGKIYEKNFMKGAKNV